MTFIDHRHREDHRLGARNGSPVEALPTRRRNFGIVRFASSVLFGAIAGIAAVRVGADGTTAAMVSAGAAWGLWLVLGRS